jgi:hypothetical protein
VRSALVGAAIALVLGAAYVGPAYADDTTPTPTTPAPAPDPAPPAPKPKPASKPAPKPAAPKPAHVYHAPVQHSTPEPSPQPTYTPPVVHHSTPKVVHHTLRHKRPKPVVVAPKEHRVKHAAVVHVAAVPTAATTNGADAVRRSLTIAGVGLAAILFLLVLAVPSTAARFTPPGRVLMDHQTDLLLVGIAVLLLTGLLFAVTGNG